MKEKFENATNNFFSAKAERRFYIGAAIYVIAVVIYQSIRFIVQNWPQ